MKLTRSFWAELATGFLISLVMLFAGLITAIPNASAQPTTDISVDPPYFLPSNLQVNIHTAILVTVLNWGPNDTHVLTAVSIDNNTVGDPTESYIASNSFAKLSFDWTPTKGSHVMRVNATALDATDENPENNIRYLFFTVEVQTYDVNVRVDRRLHAQTAIYIDGKFTKTLAGGESTRFSFEEGTNHVVGVDQITEASGTRYVADQPTIPVSSGGDYTFEYRTEYWLSLSAYPIGLTQTGESKWYLENEIVSLPKVQDIIPAGNESEYRFEHWIVDNVVKEVVTSVIMDSPHFVTASYEKYYLLNFEVVGNNYCEPIPQSAFYKAEDLVQWSVAHECKMRDWLGFFGGVQIASVTSGSERMSSARVIRLEWIPQSPWDVFTSALFLLGGILGAFVSLIATIVGLRHARKSRNDIKGQQIEDLGE